MPIRVLVTALAATLVACGPPEPTKAPAPEGPAVNEPKACTQEAKLCPDGTAVSRTGPNCEFAACPDASAPSAPAPN
ncbi:MAG: hypothetical protein KF764_00395 [Labilithrix sp.]|nr:hypothetical protein [Labilithrix sp.]